MLRSNDQDRNVRTLGRLVAVATVFAVASIVARAEGSASGAAGTAVEMTGTFSVIWGDPMEESDCGPQLVYHLRDDQGGIHELHIDEETLSAAGGLIRLDRRRVRVVGRSTIVRGRDDLAVDEIWLIEAPLDGVEDLPSARATTGPQPYVWILCRFADDPSTPEDVPWFETQAVSGHPSMDHFWREVSYNNINIVGSEVYGWYDLPRNRSYYVYDANGDGTLDANLGRMRDDAISVSNADVHFPDFIGMNLIFNDAIDDCCAWGGGDVLTLDGVTRFWGVTWMPPGGWSRHGILGHEMGHAMGLPHCSGPYDWTYDSQWGLMSAADGTRVVVDPVYGSLGVHAISYHKDKLGWIPEWARYVVGSTPEIQTVDLYSLAEIAPSGTHQMIKVPLYPTDPDQFYTIERRRMVDYDGNVPGDAVVLHHVDLTRGKPAQVVDPDGDGDCNDDGAMFMPGETFHDQDNDIVMSVLWADYNSSIVTFAYAPFSPVYVNAANGGAEDGSAAHPFNTVEEGHAAVEPEGTIYIAPGTYSHPSTRLLCRPVTLRRLGSSGAVTIGQ